MTEQQYTCPFCHKDYTRFTIHEHYGCGVEPLDADEQFVTYALAGEDGALVKVENSKEFDEGAGTLVGLSGGGDYHGNLSIASIVYGEPTETEPTVETAQPAEPPAEPKKRGRKPKAK